MELEKYELGGTYYKEKDLKDSPISIIRVNSFSISSGDVD